MEHIKGGVSSRDVSFCGFQRDKKEKNTFCESPSLEMGPM